jgi:hypothetical protein
MAIPTAQHCKTQWQYTENDSSTNKGLRTHRNIEKKGNTPILAPSSFFFGLDISGINKSPHGNWYNNGNNGTLGSNGHKGTTKHHSTHGTSKDSHMRNKWQPQVRPIIQWTCQHLDLFLALAEVACEWIVDPG